MENDLQNSVQKARLNSTRLSVKQAEFTTIPTWTKYGKLFLAEFTTIPTWTKYGKLLNTSYDPVGV